MAIELGQVIRKKRLELGIGVRELARAIKRSPSYVVMIEKGDPPPAVGEDTLRGIARELELDADKLIMLAGKAPKDVFPESDLEVALYRQVKELNVREKRELLKDLQRKRR